MALPENVRRRIEAEAVKRGADSAAAVSEAERLISKGSLAEGSAPAATGKPLADRLLIGFLPFIKVHELRSEWLGLTERIADDELTCGEYQAKYGGAGQSAVAEPAAE